MYPRKPPLGSWVHGLPRKKTHWLTHFSPWGKGLCFGKLTQETPIPTYCPGGQRPPRAHRVELCWIEVFALGCVAREGRDGQWEEEEAETCSLLSERRGPQASVF